MDDHTLINRIQHRDQEAMIALYKRHAGLAFGVAYRVLGEQTAAEECVQDAFLKIWQSAAQFDGTRGSFIGWLVQIVRNTAIDTLRRQRRKAAVDPFEGLENVLIEDNRHTQDRKDSLRRTLEDLPPDQQQVIELSYFGGLSQSEIAEKLEVPLGTVKTRARLAVQKLREAWMRE
jgi:RNA polymerase sigma-70 factor (ECF subfamily)